MSWRSLLGRWVRPEGSKGAFQMPVVLQGIGVSAIIVKFHNFSYQVFWIVFLSWMALQRNADSLWRRLCGPVNHSLQVLSRTPRTFSSTFDSLCLQHSQHERSNERTKGKCQLNAADHDGVTKNGTVFILSFVPGVRGDGWPWKRNERHEKCRTFTALAQATLLAKYANLSWRSLSSFDSWKREVGTCDDQSCGEPSFLVVGSPLMKWHNWDLVFPHNWRMKLFVILLTQLRIQ